MPAGPSPEELSSGPSLRFHHSDALQARMHAVLDALETAEDPEDHRGALADLVAELTESGMDYYYMRALKLSNAGFVAQRSAGVGISGAVTDDQHGQPAVHHADGREAAAGGCVAHSQPCGLSTRCPTSTASPCS